jgi:1-deoxy-D-xylulose-5-phosphate reductoisomerase
VQTLDVCRRHRDRFTVALLAVHRNTSRLADVMAEFEPTAVAVTDPESARAFSPGAQVRYHRGADGLEAALRETEYDILVNGIVGAAGLAPSYHALAAGRRVATANKESLVVAGELLIELARQKQTEILPIDSEHSAIWQCLASGKKEEVDRLWLTASGGSLRDRPPGDLDTITPAEALRHPTWKMGAKITVDSATMMNKGFEIIEARWLFGMPSERIEVVLHPESIVHSAVAFRDGSVIAQLSPPDMQLPIQYALSYPDRLGPPLRPLDLRKLGTLHFATPDPLRYPALALARRALAAGGAAPVVLNAANELAVEAFLAGAMPFPAICECVAAQLDTMPRTVPATLADIHKADAAARGSAAAWLEGHFSYRGRDLPTVYE